MEPFWGVIRKTSFIFLIFCLPISSKSQQPVQVLLSGINFEMPPNSKVEYNKYLSSKPSFAATWPEGIWTSPQSSTCFMLNYCDSKYILGLGYTKQAPKTVKEAALYELKLSSVRNHNDAVFTITRPNSNIDLYILETSGICTYDGKNNFLICYAIKTLQSDSIFFGIYMSNDKVKGPQTIKKIRSILQNSYKSSYNTNYIAPPKQTLPPTTAPPAKTENDNTITMSLKKIEGTDFNVVLPQGSTNLRSVNGKLSADFRDCQILYAVPQKSHSDPKDYVTDFLSPFFGSKPIPQNTLSESSANSSKNGFNVYTYLTVINVEKKLKKVMISVRSEASTNGTLMLILAYDADSPAFESSKELPKWFLGLITGFTRRF